MRDKSVAAAFLSASAGGLAYVPEDFSEIKSQEKNVFNISLFDEIFGIYLER